MKLLLNIVKINLSTKLPKQQILKVIEKKIRKNYENSKQNVKITPKFKKFTKSCKECF